METRKPRRKRKRGGREKGGRRRPGETLEVAIRGQLRPSGLHDPPRVREREIKRGEGKKRKESKATGRPLKVAEQQKRSNGFETRTTVIPISNPRHCRLHFQQPFDGLHAICPSSRFLFPSPSSVCHQHPKLNSRTALVCRW